MKQLESEATREKAGNAGVCCLRDGHGKNGRLLRSGILLLVVVVLMLLVVVLYCCCRYHATAVIYIYLL